MPRKKGGEGLVRAGDLFAENRRMMDLAKAPSRTDLRLLATAEEIHAAPPNPDNEEIAYQHSVLCQTSLPYRSVTERRWEAQNGNVMLLVQAGEAYDPRKKQWVELPLPFGPKARLILLYLNSEAIRTQSPLIDVEDSMTAFLRQLQNGRDPNGDEIQKFKQQLAALARAKISMAAADHGIDPNAIRAPHGDLPIVKFIELWFPKNPNQRVLWPGTLELTKDYFDDLTNHAVPLDQRAVAALSHSAMALDIYSWLAQRLHRVNPQRPYPLTWVKLHQQFGHGYKLIRQFRSAFNKTLLDVRTQYPEARLEANGGGLMLHNSPPPVRKKFVQISGS